MAFDAFLKLDGIKGESQDSKHKGEIDIMSFSVEATQQGSHAYGSGGGVGKAAVQDFNLVKRVDSSSPLLFLNCATGTHIKEATIVIRKAGGDQLEYLKYKLSDLIVSSIKPKGDAGNTVHIPGPSQPTGKKEGGDEIPMEEVSLNFSRIEITYQPQGSDGKAQGGPVLAGWDLKANKKI